MTNKLVSIIVPIYNVEQYLEKCIKSLIEQTYENIEILLVDDGSPDNCGKICDYYAQKDNRIKVYHKENGGYGSVLEYAINNISGEYFLICDPDDWLEEKAVETLISAATNNNVDFVLARKYLVYNDGKQTSDQNEFKILDNNNIYDNFYKFLFVPCSPHSKLYKTSLCRHISFPKKVNNTDFLLYMVNLSRISSAMYLDVELSNYYIDRPGNSFNEDIAISDKSVKSNSVVIYESMRQINRGSRNYSDIVTLLYVNACKFLSLMSGRNEMQEYKNMLFAVIQESRYKKRDLLKYMIKSTNSVVKGMVKFLIYNLFSNKISLSLAIKLLNFKK